MPFLEASGTQAATIDTEHTLSTITTNNTLVLLVDANAMLDADELTLRVKTKVLSGGAIRLIYQAFYLHAQEMPIKISIPVPSDQEYVATLEQTAGIGRSFPWKILSL